jgi:asparagine synthase (glutamine-hydrolysing)
MSGICGILNLDGAPVDRQLLEAMTEFMAYRGPEGRRTWIDGNVGFGHAMLRTTFELEREQQPCTLDGKVWITADARIDAQADLKRDLEARGRTGLKTATDPELILHAYHVWGRDCVEHLLGDFAFVIWDGPQRRLFCARDQMGVKLFYYARVRNSLVFSNTLNCVRAHPDVSDRLNDLAIADFLLFDMNQDMATTSFADIMRVPPAHYLECVDGALHTRRYWTLPIEEPIRFRRSSDYVERFRELFDAAVSDRLRADRVSVSLSGGLDSPAVAATALKLCRQASRPLEMRAFCIVYDRLIPDQERHYSGLAAAGLGIPIQYLAADDYALYRGVDRPDIRRPEPVHDLQPAMTADFMQQMAAHSRVILTGWDGDALLNESPVPYARQLVAQRQYWQLTQVAFQYIRARRRLIPWGLLRRLVGFRGKRPPEQQASYPAWIAPDLARQYDLPARWAAVQAKPLPVHPTRPVGYPLLSSPKYTVDIFEGYDPGVCGLPVEARHPLIDLRLVQYCLSLPIVPWCLNKRILRITVTGVVPKLICLRPKTPLAGWPYIELLQEPDSAWVDRFEAVPELGRYVKRASIPPVYRDRGPCTAWENMRPLSLNSWLHKDHGSRPRV